MQYNSSSVARALLRWKIVTVACSISDGLESYKDGAVSIPHTSQSQLQYPRESRRTSAALESRRSVGSASNADCCAFGRICKVLELCASESSDRWRRMYNRSDAREWINRISCSCCSCCSLTVDVRERRSRRWPDRQTGPVSTGQCAHETNGDD